MNKEENTFYTFDLDAIMNFVFFEEDKRTNDSEITETYINNDQNELTLVNKQLREVKGSDNSTKQNIKYDLLKNFIEILRTAEHNAMTLGESITFNTMFTYGLIKIATRKEE